VTTTAELTFGHSPDPDDALMLYGLAKGVVPKAGRNAQIRFPFRVKLETVDSEMDQLDVKRKLSRPSSFPGAAGAESGPGTPILTAQSETDFRECLQANQAKIVHYFLVRFHLHGD
jgi:hypothetical protein